MKFFYRFLVIVVFSTLLVECARIGNPTGGEKDEDPPVMVIAKPPHKTINFNEKEIRIYFNEYIILKDLSKQLIVSPPLKNRPIITPQGTPSKYIKIKILDTLRTNTTYTFNFGNAVQDNNENNKLESFKYVFSTGKYIDSLHIQGTVADAQSTKIKKNLSVLLYRLDSTYTDSIPFKQKPNYVTNTIDSLNFKFTNIKEGKYIVMAIDEDSKDYIFNPKTEKIGFLNDTISLPKDTVISQPIVVFKQKQPFDFKRGKEIKKGKIQFGFIGHEKNLNIKLLSEVPPNYKSFKQFEKEKDTLNYWFTPIKRDSLNFIVSKDKFIDTITVRLRKKKTDSLIISSNVKTTLHLKDTFFLKTNNPIIKIDKSKFSLVDKDTVAVNFDLKKQDFNKYALFFKKKQKNSYKLKVLPKAFTDLYEATNDTLKYHFATKKTEDYGSIVIDVKNEINKPVFIELLDNNKAVQTKFIATKSKKITFDLLAPKKYTIRAIIDTNNNNVWDTGNLILKKQPERIIHFEKQIELRSNWEVNEVFTIK